MRAVKPASAAPSALDVSPCTISRSGAGRDQQRQDRRRDRVHMRVGIFLAGAIEIDRIE
jgi:hypothetical protein